MTLTANWSRASGEQRTEEYRAWRTTLGLAGVSDVDQIEYRFVEGKLSPVAVVELCAADMRSPEIPAGIPEGGVPSPGFFAAVERKLAPERPQGRVLRLLGDCLGVPVLQVVFIVGNLPLGVWVHRVDGNGWRRMSLEDYGRGLGRL